MSEREFEAWYNDYFRGKSVDNRRLADFEACWQAALADRPEPVALQRWGLRHFPDFQGVEPWFEVMADGYWTPWHVADAVLRSATPVARPEPAQPEREKDGVCQESDGCPTEMAVLKRFWRAHQQSIAQPPWTDEAMIRFMYEMHANVAEVDRPMARMDFSDEQWARVKAAFATLAPPSHPAPSEAGADRQARRHLRAVLWEQLAELASRAASGDWDGVRTLKITLVAQYAQQAPQERAEARFVDFASRVVRFAESSDGATFGPLPHDCINVMFMVKGGFGTADPIFQVIRDAALAANPQQSNETQEGALPTSSEDKYERASHPYRGGVVAKAKTSSIVDATAGRDRPTDPQQIASETKEAK